MFERDEIDEIKAQMKLLKHELHALRSRLSVLEQQNVRLFEENRSLVQLAAFRQPETIQPIDISNSLEKELHTKNHITAQNENLFRQPESTQPIDISNNLEKQQHTENHIIAQNETAFRQPETTQSIDISNNLEKELHTENHFTASNETHFRQPEKETQNQQNTAFRQPEYATRQMPIENNIEKN